MVDFPVLANFFQSFHVSADTLEMNLLREIQVMQSLRHENIVRLEESFWDGRMLYMCMELVEGSSLLSVLRRNRLREEEAKHFFAQLCSAISYCHSNGVRPFLSPLSLFYLDSFSYTRPIQVIHGDLKPENILIRDSDQVLKVIDFGFSHIVLPGERLEVCVFCICHSAPPKNFFC
jgi:serine/threonine protein kinase